MRLEYVGQVADLMRGVAGTQTDGSNPNRKH
jgi:hypothetical protein